MTDDERRAKIVALAYDEWNKEGEVEIDDDAKVSEAEPNVENGAYVQAWVWVSFADTELDLDPEATDSK